MYIIRYNYSFFLVTILILCFFQEARAINFNSVLLPNKKSQLSIDYGKCGDFHRDGFGNADNIELNLTLSHSVSKSGVVSVGLGQSYVNLDLPLVSKDKETGFHSLIDYTHVISDQIRHLTFFNISFHKAISPHFNRNELTSYLGVGYKILTNLIIFAGPGIEIDYIGVKEELKTFADLNNLNQYETDVEFAYTVGLYYNYKFFNLYLGSGPANVLGIALGYSF